MFIISTLNSPQLNWSPKSYLPKIKYIQVWTSVIISTLSFKKSLSLTALIQAKLPLSRIILSYNPNNVGVLIDIQAQCIWFAVSLESIMWLNSISMNRSWKWLMRSNWIATILTWMMQVSCLNSDHGKTQSYWSSEMTTLWWLPTQSTVKSSSIQLFCLQSHIIAPSECKKYNLWPVYR